MLKKKLISAATIIAMSASLMSLPIVANAAGSHYTTGVMTGDSVPSGWDSGISIAEGQGKDGGDGYIISPNTVYTLNSSADRSNVHVMFDVYKEASKSCMLTLEGTNGGWDKIMQFLSGGGWTTFCESQGSGFAGEEGWYHVDINFIVNNSAFSGSAVFTSPSGATKSCSITDRKGVSDSFSGEINCFKFQGTSSDTLIYDNIVVEQGTDIRYSTGVLTGDNEIPAEFNRNNITVVDNGKDGKGLMFASDTTFVPPIDKDRSRLYMSYDAYVDNTNNAYQTITGSQGGWEQIVSLAGNNGGWNYFCRDNEASWATTVGWYHVEVELTFSNSRFSGKAVYINPDNKFRVLTVTDSAGMSFGGELGILTFQANGAGTTIYDNILIELGTDTEVNVPEELPVVAASYPIELNFDGLKDLSQLANYGFSFGSGTQLVETDGTTALQITNSTSIALPSEADKKYVRIEVDAYPVDGSNGRIGVNVVGNDGYDQVAGIMSGWTHMSANGAALSPQEGWHHIDATYDLEHNSFKGTVTFPNGYVYSVNEPNLACSSGAMTTINAVEFQAYGAGNGNTVIYDNLKIGYGYPAPTCTDDSVKFMQSNTVQEYVGNIATTTDKIEIDFATVMDTDTLNADSVYIVKEGTNDKVPYTPSYEGSVYALNFSDFLEENTNYVLHVSADVASKTDFTLGSEYTLAFHTAKNEITVSINSIKANGAEVTGINALAGASKMSVEVNYANPTGEAGEVYMAVATYDNDNGMVDITLSKITVPTNVVGAVLTPEIDVPSIDGATSMKVIIVDNFAALHPMCLPKEI